MRLATNLLVASGLVLLVGCQTTGGGGGFSLGQILAPSPQSSGLSRKSTVDEIRESIESKGPNAAARSHLPAIRALDEENKTRVRELFSLHEEAMLQEVRAAISAADQHQISDISNYLLRYQEARILSQTALQEANAEVKRHVLSLNLSDQINITLNNDLFRFEEFKTPPHFEKIVVRTIRRVETSSSPIGEMEQLAAVYVTLPAGDPLRRDIERVAGGLPSDSPALRDSRFTKAFPEITKQKRSEALARRVEVKDDRFEKSIRFTGEEGQHESPHYGIKGTNTFLIRSWLDRDSGRVTQQVYVNHFYDGSWIFWTRASDERANSLEFSQISRNVISCRGGCTYSETFGATISHDVLEKTRESGFSVKVFARTGREKIIYISADQVAAQLFAIERKKQEIGKST